MVDSTYGDFGFNWAILYRVTLHQWCKRKIIIQLFLNRSRTLPKEIQHWLFMHFSLVFLMYLTIHITYKTFTNDEEAINLECSTFWLLSYSRNDAALTMDVDFNGVVASAVDCNGCLRFYGWSGWTEQLMPGLDWKWVWRGAIRLSASKWQNRLCMRGGVKVRIFTSVFMY